MLESSPEPTLLFNTPPREYESSVINSEPPLSDLSSLPDAASPSTYSLNKSRRRAYVLVPPLSDEAKRSYSSFADRVMASDDEIEINEIIGESSEQTRSYYYAKAIDGIAYKFPAISFALRYPDLVVTYKQAQRAKTLAPFDPSADYVHPGSRANISFRIPGKTTVQRHSDDMDVDFEEGHSESEASFRSSRKSGRAAAAKARRLLDLPYSPRKNRTHSGLQSIADSDADVEDTTERQTRRSSRSKKSANGYLNDDDEFLDDDEETSDDYEEPNEKPSTKKKITRGKASRPAYGNFRVVADLYYDDVDDEDAALRAHREYCEKCHRQPAHELLDALARRKKKGKPKRKSRKGDEDEDMEGTEEERLQALGGWVRCLKCPVSAHWGCLAKTQRDEILKAAFEKDKAEWSALEEDKRAALVPVKRAGLDAYQTTEFICGSCMKGGVCMVCKEVVLEPDNGNPVENDASPATPTSSLLFRCTTCKRLTHYHHLPSEGENPVSIAEHYQTVNKWKCAECISFVYEVEHILAWRPFPENAVEPPRADNEPINHKAALPREYLVKWVDRSYRRTQWVPHMWLVATHTAKLKNFLSGGSKVRMLPEPVSEDAVGETSVDTVPPTFEIGEEETGSASAFPETISSAVAYPDAERRIPPAWRTVDRVLDVLFWYPDRRRENKIQKLKRKGKDKAKRGVKRVESDEEDDDEFKEEVKEEYEAAYALGEQPSRDLTETIEDREHRTDEKIDESMASEVIWAFFKWDDLGYEDASWDSPPRAGEPGRAAFEKAFKRYLDAREVTVPRRSAPEIATFERRAKDSFMKKYSFTTENQPQLGQDAKFSLMPFQVDGVNWLCNNWWNMQHCILADEMGLGKTVQVVTFLGAIMDKWGAFPALVVVPNSTISNWVREFERWAPALRVVPFSGESKAREIIKRYELVHPTQLRGTTGAKYHVLVTTYEMITNAREFTPVFKSTLRWEVLVVDEGQRLKNDNSLIFKKLRELNTRHRIILTGTPLNNNIRELFNLMNFLDPEEWNDLENLAREHEVLTEESIKELHNRLRPYFLRRTKSEVLQLPPKNEVIVPVSMTSLQKEIYKSIFSQNLDMLQQLAKGLVEATKSKSSSAVVSRTNMNNILMQLRKCLQHPYLVSESIEPGGLPPRESHEKLIDASAKLRLLKVMLPKLKSRGHRVLLFSQFVIALDIIEDFLIGERIKYLRLDGNTKQADRQKGMDEFNKPDSDVFIYLLTTRAGGVGINLWSADTVIVFDPDFNPHQDLQAIARAHRYGQKKTVLVFKLMVKDSAEEKIMQTGKKKLVLDHLIVQSMDDEAGSKEDVQSILMFGAKTLFEADEDHSRDIHYSEHDIETLIERTEKEGDQAEPEAGSGFSFAFAKVWSADKDNMEEMPDDAQEADQVDSWTLTMNKLVAERTQAQAAEKTGRGVRRRAAAVFPQQNLNLEDTPGKDNNKKKGKGKKSKSVISEESDAYNVPKEGVETDGDSTDDNAVPLSEDLAALASGTSYSKHQSGAQKDPTVSRSPILNRPKPPKPRPVSDDRCGLCEGYHAGPCYLTQSPENLAAFRLLLLIHAGDEPVEERRAAIRAIDETLFKLGRMEVINGQPLHLVETAPSTTPLVKPPPHHKPVQVNNSTARASGSKDKLLVPHLHNASTILPENANAGPSKRPRTSPPTAPKKKPRESGVSPCTVCHGTAHLLKDCPVVVAGPESIQAVIKRLEVEPSNENVVGILHKLLRKQQKRQSKASLVHS